MRARKNKGVDASSILVDTEELMKLLATGRPAAVQIGTEAGARVQVGRLVRWNVKKIQEYIDRASEG